MGKSTSCLRRIISCGGDDSNEAAGPVDQAKSSKTKKGWSFKKRSSAGRAVTNSLIAETTLPAHKENVQSAATESIVAEKDSALQLDEKSPPQLAADLYATDAVNASDNEKQPTTATATADLYATDAVNASDTEKQPTTATATADLYVDDVSVSETEKQSDTADFCGTDGLTVSKTGEYDAVLAVHESDVIIIQSVVRGFLARKDQIKHKSVVKLQAAVRGHLVRCHAVGALRCVQAIAKMQVLARARYARARKDGTLPKSKPEITYTSMTDLLKNSFARQLLESSPKSKPIKIKCDPLSRDSSWVWLERWMSLASPGAVDDLNAGTETVQEVKNIGSEPEEEKTIDKEQEQKIIVEDYLFNEENEIFMDAKDFTNSSLSSEFSKLDVKEEMSQKNSGELTLTNVDSPSASSIPRQKADLMDGLETVESATKIDSVNHQVVASEKSVDEKSEFQTGQALQLETEIGNELGIQLKTEAEDVQLETEEEKIVLGSQIKPDNLRDSEPELVSVPVPAILSDTVPQDARVEEPISATHLDVVYHDLIQLKGEAEEGPASVPTSAMDDFSEPQNAETKEVVPHSSEFDLNVETAASSDDDIVINHNEPSQPDHSSIQVGESECGTDLSITSTLDSPDRSEIEPMKVKLEKFVSANAEFYKSNTAGDEFETESGSVEKGKSDSVIGESTEHPTASDKGMDEKELETNVSTLQSQSEAGEEKETETNASNLPAEPEVDTERSHQASPGSQVTFSESQGTPSSQVSVPTKSKIAKSEKSGSIKKRTILSAAKKSPSNDSSGKSSSEQLPKEQKSIKRRTSLGSPKPDVSDQEQRRESSTSSSLPSYMQATESARAKANAGHSPRSSPDVADNDVFLRKRHSLSGTKDKQESPRLRRASSQAQSGSKSNGSSPLERKWQR